MDQTEYQKKKKGGLIRLIARLVSLFIILFMLANIGLFCYAIVKNQSVTQTFFRTYGKIYCTLTEHNFVEKEVVPTCEDAGYRVTVCTRCAEEKDRVALGDAIGHSYSYSATFAPTCEGEGYDEYICSNCNKTEQRNKVAPLGHNDEMTHHEEATCEVGGYDLYVCNVCNREEKKNEVAPLGHNYTKNVYEATCVQDGYAEYVCNRCDFSYREDGEQKTGHVYSEEVILPTCAAEGKTRHFCQKCDYYYADSFTPKTEHDYEVAVETDSTCTVRGYTVYSCADCGDDLLVYKELLAHDYALRERVEAECETDGYLLYVCRDCSADFKTVLEAPGHILKQDTKQAGCETEGEKYIYCTACSYREVNETSDALGHVYITGVCKNCSSEEASTAYMQFETVDGLWTLTAYTGNASVLTIPKYAQGKVVQAIGQGAISHSELAKLSLPNTVETVHTQAFNGCDRLRTVDFGGSQVAWRYLAEDNFILSQATVCYGVGQYGYTQLASDWQDFYFEYYKLCQGYRLGQISAEYIDRHYVIGTVSMSDHNVDRVGLVEILTVFKYDNPKFYWISQTVSVINTGTSLTAEALVVADTVNKVIRDNYETAINAIYFACEQQIRHFDSEDVRARILYDYVVQNTEYAYGSDGKPESSVWAHSIEGFLSDRGVVCEGYTKMYQLLCDRFGISCIACVGYVLPDNGHSWNLIRLSDGNYHCVDLTWDVYLQERSEFERLHKVYTPTGDSGYWVQLPENIV